MKKVLAIISLIVLVAFMIAGCGGVKSEAKSLYKDYFISASKITEEFQEEVGELADKYENKKITRKKLVKKLTKLADNAIEDLEELKSKLDKEDVAAENKRLKIYAITYIYENERFISVAEDAIVNHRGTKSTLAIRNRKAIMRNAGNDFIREYNYTTKENIMYFLN